MIFHVSRKHVLKPAPVGLSSDGPAFVRRIEIRGKYFVVETKPNIQDRLSRPINRWDVNGDPGSAAVVKACFGKGRGYVGFQWFLPGPDPLNREDTHHSVGHICASHGFLLVYVRRIGVLL